MKTFGTVGTVCCVYDDIAWLEPSIASVYEVSAAIYFLISAKPWNGDARSVVDTIAAIGRMPDPDQKFRIIRGTWETEESQRNAGLAWLRAEGIDGCIIVDSDEVYARGDISRMCETARNYPDISCWSVGLFTYWKSEAFVVDPPESFMAPVIVSTYRARFTFRRHVECLQGTAEGFPLAIRCHHLSYARTNAELLRKITSFSHKDEVLPGWFENVWLAWDENPAMTNLHPTFAPAYARARAQPFEALPEPLRDFVTRRAAESR